jgi:hypothetical protein
MKIPEILKIGGKEIKVSFVAPDSLENSNVAMWFPDTFEIKIEDLPGAPIQRKEEAFLHETIEAINAMYELNLVHWKITLLGELLYQIFKDNDLEL